MLYCIYHNGIKFFKFANLSCHGINSLANLFLIDISYCYILVHSTCSYKHMTSRIIHNISYSFAQIHHIWELRMRFSQGLSGKAHIILEYISSIFNRATSLLRSLRDTAILDGGILTPNRLPFNHIFPCLTQYVL